MDRRTFLRYVGLGGLAAASGGWLESLLSSSYAQPNLRGTLPSLAPNQLAQQLPQMISGAAGNLRQMGRQAAAFVRSIPQLGEDLPSAFGGTLWRQLSGHLPSRLVEAESFMAGHWGNAQVERAFKRLQRADKPLEFVQIAAEEAGMSWAQVEKVGNQLGQSAEPSLTSIPVSTEIDRAINTIASSNALREALSPLGQWKRLEDINLHEALTALYAMLLAHPQEWAVITEAAFNSGSLALAPVMSVANLPALLAPNAPLAPLGMSQADVVRAPSLKSLGKGAFFLAEVPFNLIVMVADCLESGFKHDADRIKLVAETVSFVLAYGATWLYSDPPIDTYTNGIWSIMSFGEDIVLEFVKRRRKEIGKETLEMIWAGVATALLFIYHAGLWLNPPRPGWAIETPTGNDRSAWEWVPMTIWCVLTKILCRLCSWAANRYMWKFWALPAIWIGVYLVGCGFEVGSWLNDYLDA